MVRSLWNLVATGSGLLTCLMFLCFVSSPEPLASYVSSYYRQATSSVRRPHTPNVFSTERTGPITAKFHMEPQWTLNVLAE